MKHIIIGLVGIIVGLWGIALNWYQFLDLLWVLVPMAVLLGGIIALLAGISNFSKESRSEIPADPDKR
ncbi:MAG: hypothetical protein JRJ69_06850 [Deltaproteobacteria bacterium]|nr:hypothetical protein [Deltaproteobacteria bacterium]RLB27721.1 MAG: hypothetical protein DRG87_10825 [Deltaproteobacteria bacterium]